MFEYHGYGSNYKFQRHSTKELLKMQSRGKFLTPNEKKEVQREAELRRKRRN